MPGSTQPRSNDGEGFPYICIGATQKVASVATSTQSTAVGAHTSIVKLYATKACFVLTGADPTAVADTAGMYMPDASEAIIGIKPGDKIAVIRSAADGSLYVTEGL